MAGAHGISRKPDYSDGLRALQQITDRIRFQAAGHIRILIASANRSLAALAGIHFLFEHSQRHLAHSLRDFLVAGEIAEVLH